MRNTTVKFFDLFLLKILLVMVCLNMVVTSCAPFQDSPFSDTLLSKETNLNMRAMDRIKSVETDGVIRIVVLADAHQNYSALADVIYEVNLTAGVDFVVNLGDFTNGGFNLEYDQYIDIFTELRRPGLTVIGNHDSIGAGPSLYKKAFSPVNFWFESDTKRYVFFNTANLENAKEFDPQWLTDTVNASTKPVMIFTHCSLQDGERFTGVTAQTLTDVINNPKVLAVLNGHNHVYTLASSAGTVLLQAPRIEGSNWMILEIRGTQLKITNMNNGTTAEMTLKN